MKKTILTITTISFILFIIYISLNDETTTSKKSVVTHTPLVLDSVEYMDEVDEMEVESVEVFEKQEVNDVEEQFSENNEYNSNKEEVDFDSELALGDEDMEKNEKFLLEKLLRKESIFLSSNYLSMEDKNYNPDENMD